MLKKTRCLFLLLIFLICFSVPVFATNPTDGSETETVVTEDPQAGETPVAEEQPEEAVPAEGASEDEAVENIPTDDSTDVDAEDSEQYGVTVDQIVYDPYVEETEQFLVDITRPVESGTTFEKSYVICGINGEEDVKLIFAIKDEETGEYKYFSDNEGDSSWDVAGSEAFSKKIMLSQGPNNLKIIAYKKSEADSLVVGENVQVNYYTITVLKKSLTEKIMDGVSELTEKLLKGIF